MNAKLRRGFLYFVLAITLFVSLMPAASGQSIPSDQDLDPRAKAEAMLKQRSMNLVFEENRGQWDAAVLYRASGEKGTFSVLRDGVSIMILKPNVDISKSALPGPDTMVGERKPPLSRAEAARQKNEARRQDLSAVCDADVVKSLPDYDENLQGWVWNYRFRGMNPEARVTNRLEVKQAGLRHYITAEGSISNVKSFKEVWIEDIYPGIDLRLYGDGQGGLEYDLIAYPGSNPFEVIDIEFEGIEAIRKDESGKAWVTTGIGEVGLPAPYSYQHIDGQEKEVDVVFEINDHGIRFAMSAGSEYDEEDILILDPMILDWSILYGARMSKLVTLEDGTFLATGSSPLGSVVLTPGSFGYGSTVSWQATYVTKFTPEAQVLWTAIIPGFISNPYDLHILPGGAILVSSYSCPPPNWPLLPFTSSSIQTAHNGNCVPAMLALSPDGTTSLWCTLLGNYGNDFFIHLNPDSTLTVILVNSRAGLPVTAAGRAYSAGNDCYLAKLRIDGTLVWGTYFGGSGTYDGVEDYRIASNGDIYLRGYTDSQDLPVTPGAGLTSPGGSWSIYLAGFRGSDGGLKWATYQGEGYNNWFDAKNTLDISSDGLVFISGINVRSYFPLTANAPDKVNECSSSYYNCYEYGVTAVNTADGSFYYSTYLGGNFYEEIEYLRVLDDYSAVVVGNTMSADFPVTLNAAQPMYGGGSSGGGAGDFSISRIALDGSLLWSTYWGGPGEEWIEYGSDVYGIGHMDPHPSFGPDGLMYIAASAYRGSSMGYFPTTPDAAIREQEDGGVLFSVDIQTGQIPMSTYVPIDPSGSNPGNQYIIVLPDTTILLYGQGSTGDYNIYPTADAPQSIGKGSDELYLGRFARNGRLIFSTLMGSEGSDMYGFEEHPQMIVTDTIVYIWSRLRYYSNYPTAVGFPYTAESPYQNSGGGLNAIMRFRWNTWYVQDSLLPVYQEVCDMSNDIQPLAGTSYYLELFREGVPSGITLNPPEVQWQFSTDSLNWIDISGAIDFTYQPQASNVTTWYRRLIKDNGKVVMMSRPAKVEIRPFLAPMADPGVNQYICPGGSVVLGGSPTASGGQPPYAYTWAPLSGLTDSTLSNPTASPVSGITGYTLRVIDAQQCSQVAQVAVEVIRADAGPDRMICPGESVVLTAPAYPGATTVNYTWSALNGSGIASIENPFAGSTRVTPSLTTTYAVYVDDGGVSSGVCPSDTVTVSIVSPPVANAGPDVYLCEYQGWGMLGGFCEPGHSYYWSPGSNINSTSNCYSYYDGTFPYGYPGFFRQYVLTVIKDDAVCVAGYDTVNVYVGFAHGGPDGCGPRYIGSSDFTGGLAKYLWTVQWGDTSSLAGQDSMATPFVNPNVTTQYQLQVTINGVTCYDWVTVPPCGCPIPYEEIMIPIHCDTYNQQLPYKIVPKNIDTVDYTYEWTGGDLSLLDNPFTATPNVIAFVPSLQVYQVIARHKVNPLITCIGTVTVSSFYGSPPVALTGPDKFICPGVTSPVYIGAANIPGLEYKWTPLTGLSANDVSNPSANPPVTTLYTLMVSDPGTGCQDTGLVEVVVRSPIADAGGDRYFCSAGSFVVGAPEEVDMAYLWQPSQFVSDTTVAQPVANIYSDQIRLYLTVTDTMTGCIDRDTVLFHQTIPFVAAAGPDMLVCEGGNPVRLGTTDSTQFGATYQWLPVDGLDDPNSPTPLALPLTTTTYKLIVSPSSSQGCDATDEVTVTVIPPGPLAVDAGPDHATCGSAPVQIGPAPQSGLVYSWTPHTGLSDPGIAQPMADPIENTVYVLTVRDTLNCLLGQDEVQINKIILPTNPGGQNIWGCQGDTIVLGQPAIPGATYQWSTPGGFYMDDPTAAMPRVVPLYGITYYVTVTLNGCVAYGNQTVTMNYTPPVTITPDTVDICNGPVQLNASYNNRFAYYWTPTTGLSDPRSRTPWANPSDTTLYVVAVMSWSNGCYQYDSVLVRPAFPINAGNDATICQGESVPIGYQGKQGLTYAWSPATGLSDPSASNPVATPTQTTVYTLTVSNGVCTRTDQVTVTVKVPGTLAINSPGILCDSTCLRLSLSEQNGPFSNIQWSPPALFDDPASLTPYLCVDNPVTVSVSAYHNQTGCPVSADLTIFLNPAAAPTADAGRDTVICYGDYVTIGTDGPDSLIYEWSPQGLYVPNAGAEQPLVSPYETTIYTLKVTDPLSQCYSLDEVVVEVRNVQLDVWFWEEICRGQSIAITYLNEWEAYGTNNFTAQWSPSGSLSDPSSFSPIASPDTTTLYKLVITDIPTGCQATGYGLLEVNNGVLPSADPGRGLTVCVGSLPGDSVQIGIPPQPGLRYSWYPWWNMSDPYTSNPWVYGITSTSSSNTYYLYVEDTTNQNYSCNWIEYEFELEVVDTSFQVSLSDVVVCQGDSVMLSPVVDNPDGYALVYQWTPSIGMSVGNIPNPMVSPTTTTNYLLNVNIAPLVGGMNVKGCSQLHSVKVIVEPKPVVNVPDLNIACGVPEERWFKLTPNPAYKYRWSPISLVTNPVQANPFFIGWADTSLILEVTSKKGCQFYDTVGVLFGDTTPPYLSCPADAWIDCNADTSISALGMATAIDNCDPAPVIWYQDEIVQGTCGVERDLIRTWYAQDTTGNIRSCAQTILIRDTIRPVITCPADIILNCPADTTTLNTGVATATDVCGPGAIVTYLDQVVHGCGNSFTVYRTWRAMDDCGNVSECLQTIIVQDTTPPVITCPPDAVLDCPADTSVQANGQATATDECSGLMITHSDQLIPICGHSWTIHRIWRATDDCGNFSECVQTIVVQDTTPPQITCPPDTTVTAAYGVCEAYISLGEPVVTDECTLFDYVNTYTQTSNASGIYPAGTTHVWWAASDYCGNPSACLQTVTVRNYPMAHNDDTIVATGSTVLIPVLNNDFDCQDLLVESCVAVVTPPSQGTATVNLQTGVITYVPNLTSLNVNDTFYYSMCNEFGLRDTARVTVTYRTPPAGQLVGSDIICVGTSAMLAVYLTGEAPFTIWVSNGITTTMYSGITGNLWTRWVSPLHTTTYSLVWVQDATTLKVAGTGTALIQVLAPQSFVVTGGGIYNQGGPGVVVGLSGSQMGVSYQLYHNGSPTGMPVVGTGQPLSFGYQQLEGYYTVVGTDLVEGCTAPMTASVQVQMNPAPAICTVSGGGICCLGCYDLEIELSCSEVGIVYELLRNGNPTGRILQGTGGILVWDKLVYTGTYTVRATNPITGATQLMSGTATVQFYPLPSAVVSGSTTIIQGQSAVVSVAFTGTPPYRIRFTDGIHYTMREGIMTNTWDTLVSPMTTTTYHVEYVYDGHGCGDLGTGTATVTVLPPKTGSVSGLVQYASSAKPAMGLSGVKVMLVDASMQKIDSTLSDQTGQYSITHIPAGQYYLLLHHGDISGGYNATDAMLVMQHFTQQSILMPISAEAGDVNQSGFLNASDALLIAQRFVGMQSTFPAGEWVFEVHSLTITVNGEALLQDLLGLCYGDVNGSYAPVPKQQSHAGIRVLGSMDRRRLEQEGLPLYVEERVELGAVSLVLRGSMVKEVEEVLPGGALGGEVVWTKTGDELRLAWYNATGQPLPAGEEAFRLKLKPGAWDNAGSMTLEAGPGSELANGSGLRYGMVKMYHPEAVTATGAAELEVWPNPVEDVLKLRYYQPQPGQVKITLRDITQRELEVISEGMRQAGEHTWEVDFSQLPAGTYYVQLQHDSGADLIRKVVHIE